MPERPARAWRMALAALWAFLGIGALARAEDKPLHWSADKTYWDRHTNKVELFGRARVEQPDETISADYILLDRNLHTLDARGNAVYISHEAIIHGEEMHFNLETRTGTVIAGRVSNEKFSLAGERINKLGEGRFQTHWGEYSTCRDCPQSWTLLAEDVDLEFDAYAYLTNVTTKIKEAPALWLPYLVVPVKTRRQTGFLFPKIATGGPNGFSIVEPFFWAINRSADMTVAAGDYAARGFRAEAQARYALSARSSGRADFFLLHDKQYAIDPTNPTGNPMRWGLTSAQTQELPYHIDAKLKLNETSDSLYPSAIGDIPGSYEPVLTSDFSLSRASDEVSAFIALHRVRNLLNIKPPPNVTTPGDDSREFDPHTVQVFPRAAVTTNDQFLFGSSLATGLSFEFANFTRSAGGFDSASGLPDQPYQKGVDPLREARRASITPSLYTTLRPFDIFSVVPSLQYRSYFYNFNQNVPNLTQSYLLTQVNVSTQLERIYDEDNPDHPRLKHLIRPYVTLSYIPEPLIHQDARHPFIEQIRAAGTNGGYQFDQNDIIPLDNQPSTVGYFTPLGRSVEYGFTTQLTEREGNKDNPSPSYAKLAEFSAGQAFNLREYYPGRTDATIDSQGNPIHQPFSRLFSDLNFSTRDGRVLGDINYYYYPYLDAPKSVATTTFTYVLERGLHEQILTFDRSVSFAYYFDKTNPQLSTQDFVGTLNYSINDYILPSVSLNYDFLTSKWLSAVGSVQFQSPSRCWKLAVSVAYNFNQGADSGFTPSFDASLNISGTGFGGISEATNSPTPP